MASLAGPLFFVEPKYGDYLRNRRSLNRPDQLLLQFIITYESIVVG